MGLNEEYIDYCNKFNAIWKYIESCSKNHITVVKELCEYRMYYGDFDRWSAVLKGGIAFVSKDSCSYDKMKGSEFSELALFKDDYFLMNERYIIPIRDMLGNVIALVGWYPDSKRYITTPSRFFSKNGMFFGMEQFSKGLGGNYFLVEGIFDALNLRSLGFNAIAQMGASASDVKEGLYGLISRIVAVPDVDKTGRKVIKNDTWKIPSNASYLTWKGGCLLEDGEISPIKDIDRLCSLFEKDDIIALLNSCFINKSKIISIPLDS